MNVFLFGSGLHPHIRAALKLPNGKPVMLEGAQAVLRGDNLGAALSDGKELVAGELVTLEPTHPFFAVMKILNATKIEVTIEGALATAFGQAEAGDPWNMDDWAPIWAPVVARSIHDIVQLSSQHSDQTVMNGLGQIVARAASWVRAQSEITQMSVRHGFTDQDVHIAVDAQPYLNYFSIAEQDLSFRNFDGAESETVSRAAFVSGDAVTVLPYDPVRGRVLVVEQFRFGPFSRGDNRPWSLEPIAGRIDPGEHPHDCARREAEEETGLAIKDLHHIANYYPSPGAVTEYLYSYIGIADLPDEAAGIAGLDTEAEDIRGVILSIAELEALIASGEAQNGPLLLSAFWLLRNKAMLDANTPSKM